MAGCKDGDPERQSHPERQSQTTCTFIFKLLLLPALWLLMLPYIIISICLTGKVNDKFLKFISCNSKSDESHETIDRVMKRSKKKLEYMAIVFATRLGCLLLPLAVVLLHVDGLVNLKLFGIELWQWCFLAAFFSLASVVVFIVLTLILSLVYTFFKLEGSELDYYLTGLQESTRWLLSFALILIDWQVFIVAHSTDHSPSQVPLDIPKNMTCNHTSNSTHSSPLHVNNYGTLTLLSLTIGASLWLLKCLLLLWWVAKYIYRQDKGKILAAGFHLYFLLHIFRQQNKKGQQHKNKDDPQNKKELMTLSQKKESMIPWANKSPSSNTNAGDSPTSNTTTAGSSETPDETRAIPIEQYMSSIYSSSQQIDEVAKCLRSDRQLLGITEENDDTPHIPPNLIKGLHDMCRSSSEVSKMTEDFLVRQPVGLEKNDAELLLKVMADTNPEVINNPHEFENWLIAAHRSCYQLRCKLIADSQLTNILNNVLRVLIVVVVIITWLFLTQFATTKLVITLGSLLAGVLFMVRQPFVYFADGLIFTFVNRTLKVGDRYLVEGQEMEVKKICILTTTFFVNRRMDYVTYTNQQLATKSITKLKVGQGQEWQQDLEDYIELELDSSTTSASQMSKLQDRINKLLEAKGKKISQYSVVVKEVKSKVMMSIHYLRNLEDDEKDPRAIQFNKNNFRSELLDKIKQYLEVCQQGLEDCVELELDSSTSVSQMLKLQVRINKLLNGHAEYKTISKDYSVVVKEVNSTVTMNINYLCILEDEEKDARAIKIHKNKFRSDLLIQIKQYLEECQQHLEDCIELELDLSTSVSQMLKLKDRINKLLKGHAEDKKILQDYSVLVKEVNSKVMMNIHYLRTLGDEEKDPRAIQIHKNKFRSELLNQIKQYLEGLRDDDVEVCQKLTKSNKKKKEQRVGAATEEENDEEQCCSSGERKRKLGEGGG